MGNSGRNVTIKEIAQDVGVTQMTVSRALSGKGRISAERRHHIQRVASRMGYQPNTLARSLRTF